MRYGGFFILWGLLLATVWISNPVPAQAASATLVDQEELVAISLKVKVGSKTSRKNMYCYNDTLGSVKDSDEGLLFKSVGQTLAELKRRKAAASKIALYKEMKRIGKSECRKTREPTETPPPGGASPTPTPRATATPAATGNFDNGGNVTSAGKAAFGIPSNLSASISTGKTIHDINCKGCHAEKTNRSFNQLRISISASPMFFTQQDIPDSALANLTAYLNRFRP